MGNIFCLERMSQEKPSILGLIYFKLDRYLDECFVDGIDIDCLVLYGSII